MSGIPGFTPMHKGEINDRIYLPVQSSLESITFPSEPLGRDSEGRPTSRVTFEIPTQVKRATV